MLEASGSPDEGQQGNMAGTLDRGGQRALMFGAGAGLAARLDLAALGDVAPQAREVLVVDLFDAVHAEGANLAARAKAAAAEASSAAWALAIAAAFRAGSARRKAARSLAAFSGARRGCCGGFL